MKQLPCIKLYVLRKALEKLITMASNLSDDFLIKFSRMTYILTVHVY